ncbi:hypothetical protein Tco_0660364, partial [Tanacetum coccineum]
YALTHDPIIFDSLVKQFWSTASLRAPELDPPAILATIDRTSYTITEDTETDIQEKDEKQSQKRQSTGWKRQSQIEAKVSQIQKVNPDKVKSQPSEENTT